MDFAKIRPRGGTKAQWEKANPVLAKREIGVQWETTIGVGEVVIKIGDGVTDWINLPEAVKSDITKKIIAALAVVPDDDPDLADGDSLDTLFGKIAKKFKYLKDNKLDKSARYDGTDSTSTELVPTANALRGVNAKADKNASDITTLNNNLSNFHFYNNISQLGLSSGVSIQDLLAKMPAPSIGIFYCLNKNITGLPFDTQCVVTVFKQAQPFRIEVQDIWSGRTYVAKFSNDTVNGFVEYALKSDLNDTIFDRVKITWNSNPDGLLLTVDKNNKLLIPISVMTGLT